MSENQNVIVVICKDCRKAAIMYTTKDIEPEWKIEIREDVKNKYEIKHLSMDEARKLEWGCEHIVKI